MAAKYPYLKHYFISYQNYAEESEKVDFKDLAELFIEMEGFEEFIYLIKEMKELETNDDWDYLINFANESVISLNKDQMSNMFKATMNVYKHAVSNPEKYKIYKPENKEIDEREFADNYISRFSEWQNNQFNPGHFTGGRIPNIYWSPISPNGLPGYFLHKA